VAIDNARLYAEARRQQQWLRASAEVTQRLLSDADPADVLALITQQALEISGADLVVLALPAGGGEVLIIEHASGAGAANAMGLALPLAGSASGLVMATGKALTVDNFGHDERVAQVAREQLHLGPAVVVPLGSAGNVRGVLTAGRHEGSLPLAPPAVEMVVTFAAQAGIGLELAEHRRDAQQLALFADRDRIARDLHDLVIQRLFATGMSLEGAGVLIKDPEAGNRVRLAVDALDETIREIRSAIFALQSHDGPEIPGVRARILGVVEEATSPLGFAPSLRMDGRLDAVVPESVAEHLLAVLREALSNAARHAGASRVDVAVSVESTGHNGRDVMLTVRDNGTGIPSGTRRSGLANMTDRATALGGSMRTDPAGSGGTELTWRVPLPGPPG
jgi:signal transduction histidine kinase